MRDRLLVGARALTRFVLVVVALGLAVGSIGLSAVRGFCPEIGDGPLAMPLLATVVVDTGDTGDTDAADTGTTEDPPTDDVTPSGEAPAEDAPAEEAPAQDAPAEEAVCPGGQQRCLPPLWSSILLVGQPDCHEEAPARLRSTLVPALVGSTILLAGAWWLRPTRLPAEQAARDE